MTERMVLVFDLDDTLYQETTFVLSGFRAVAQWLADNFSVNEEAAFQIMKEEFEQAGRGKVFDTVLHAFQLYNLKRVRQCVSVYRLHLPKIRLDDEAVRAMERFADYHKYLVTDGNKTVQFNKVKALQLDTLPYFRKIFVTYRYGIKNGKPSPYCFNKICTLEKVQPGDVVYIGDNPSKDFVGIKPLGFKTIRIIQGHHRDVKLSNSFEAHLAIDSLDQLTPQLLKKLKYLNTEVCPPQ